MIILHDFDESIKSCDRHYNSGNYQAFRTDMNKCFAMSVVTDRIIDPETGSRDFTEYFRIINRMKIAHCRDKKSKFYFNELFIESVRAGYLKHLDYKFCIQLDREGQALARFIYQHVIKRLGKKMYYVRNLDGFLTDIGLGSVTKKALKHKNWFLKKTFYPALDQITNAGIFRYELTDYAYNIVFYSPKAQKTIDEYRNGYRQMITKKKAVRNLHEDMAASDPALYIAQVKLIQRGGKSKGTYFEDIYRSCLKKIN